MNVLDADDAPAVRVHNPQGTSQFLLLGDHAGNVVPRSLNDLGLKSEDLHRHIAWDIGIGDLGVALAERLDAVFLRQTFSRLVIDCNRNPVEPDAIPEISDGTVIPGNFGLDSTQRAARVAGIHAPYQAAIAAEILRRGKQGQATMLVSLHSFTPTMNGIDRPWDIGVLHDGHNDAFAMALLETLNAEPGLVVGDNQPYRMDVVDHTVPRHAFPAGLPYVEIEIRQDHLETTEGVTLWEERLANWLMATRSVRA